MKPINSAILTAVFVAALAFPALAVEPPVQAPVIASASAVLMDADTGQVLFDKNMGGLAYPASTTKIMTALLVCENVSPNEVLTVTQSAVDIDEWNSANAGLIPGEELTVRDTLYALMLPSANDAANALAEHVAGSQERFVERMNQRAWQLGARDTRFENAHGLHVPMHYTTAYDMAQITRMAAQNESFMAYFGAAAHTVPPTNLQPAPRPFTNFQSMLVPGTAAYDSSVLGGKVGYTGEAQHTMSTIAQRGGRTLVCVVMKSAGRNDKFTDTAALLAYGFDSFRPVSLPADRFTAEDIPVGDGSVSLTAESEFSFLLRNDLSVDAVRVSLELPAAFSPADQLPTSAPILLDTGDPSLPALLGHQPLVARLHMDSGLFPAVSVSASTGTGRSVRFVLIGVAVATALALVALIARHIALQRRHRKRLEALNKRIRDNFRPGRSA